MFETLGLGVDFKFKHSGHSDMLQAINDMGELYSLSNRTTEQSQKLGESFLTLSSGIGSAGKVMMGTGVATGLATIGGILKSSDFQSEFTGLLKYMSDDSAAGVRSFNHELSESAKWLGITKNKVMDAAQAYMQMGLSQEKSLEMGESAAFAGKVWDVSSEEAAVAFKGISASYNMDFLAKDTRDNFIDMVNYVADYTSLAGGETLDFLSAAGAGLRLIGNTDMAGAMGIAAAARKAEVDIGHLGYGMRQITKIYAQKGDSIFKKIGIDVRDASGALKPFDQALAEASKVINNYDQDVQAAFAMELGQRYSDDVLRILGGWDEYDKTMQVIASGDYAGSAQREWDKITNTFEHNSNVTSVLFSDFIQSTFGQLLPTVTNLLKVFNKVFESVNNFLAEHPTIGKFVAGFLALSSVFLIVGGAALFFGSKILSIVTTFGSFGIKINSLKTAITAFGGVFKTMGSHVALFAKQMLGYAAIFGALYFIWKYDIFGIRGALENFVSSIKYAFETSKDIVSKDAKSISSSLAQLDVSDKFVDKLTALFVRVRLAFDSVKAMWTDYTISEELYDKLVASGMEPTVTSLMMLIYRFRNFWNGFKDGFIDGCNSIRYVVTTVFGPAFSLISKIMTPLLGLLSDFLVSVGVISKESSLINSSANEWQKLGAQIGVVVSIVASLMAVGKVISVIMSIGGALGKVFGLLKVFGPLISGLGGLIGPAVSAIVGGLGSILTAIGGMLASALAALVAAVGWPVILIGLAIAAVIALIVIFWDDIKAGFFKFIDFMKNLPIVQALGELFSNIGNFIKANWQGILLFLINPIGGIFKLLYDNFEGFRTFVDNFIENCFNIGKKIVETISNGIKSAGSAIVNGIKSVFGMADEEVMPHSDAKSGPFSRLTQMGRSIPETIASGIVSNSDVINSAMSGIDSPMISAGYNVSDPEISGLPRVSGTMDLSPVYPDIVPMQSSGTLDVYSKYHGLEESFNGNMNITANSSGLEEMYDGIVMVFINVLEISRQIENCFMRVSNVVPYNNVATAERVSSIYDDRMDYNNVGKDNGNNIELKFEEGAFQFNISTKDAESFKKITPEIKEEIGTVVVDVVKKLKDEQYEF